MLLQHHIALWDVIYKCDIIGSADSSIKNVASNDINVVLKNADINKIVANGSKAEELYNKYCFKQTEIMMCIYNECRSYYNANDIRFIY